MLRPGSPGRSINQEMLTSNCKDQVISHPNFAFNTVALAASLGGLKAIGEILSGLPSDFPAAITVVQHLHPNYTSHIADIFSRRTLLKVKNAQQGELLRPGVVYVAIPNKHLLVNPDATIGLSNAPKVHYTRPSADLLFQSLANSFKSRAIAVVLTGRDSDGILGVQAIKRAGGTVIAQNEESCQCFSMPQAAISTGEVDFVLPLSEIAAQIVSLVTMEKVA